MLILKYICMSVKSLRFIQKGPIFLFQTSENLVRGTKPVDGPAKLLGRFLSLTTKTWQLALLGKRISSVELSVATWLELKAAFFIGSPGDRWQQALATASLPHIYIAMVIWPFSNIQDKDLETFA